MRAAAQCGQLRPAEERRSKASSVPRKLTPEVRRRLLLHQSPERIAGAMKLEGFAHIGFVRICQWIREDRARGGHLWAALPRRGRNAGAAGRSCIPERVDLSERSAAVEEKSRPSDWEVDAIVGANHRGALVTAVDRKTKFVCIRHVERKTKDAVSAALIEMLKRCKDIALTVTADNGSEFAGHAEVTAALGSDFYFATPCHSRERGLNENANGRIRRFFGKGEDLRVVDPAKVE